MLFGAGFGYDKARSFPCEKLIIREIYLYLQQSAKTFRSQMYLIPTNKQNSFSLRPASITRGGEAGQSVKLCSLEPGLRQVVGK